LKNVIVVGGGLTGLAAAHELNKAGASVSLVESGKLGGKILTDRVDGFLIEGGPDSLISYKPAALELCRELGLGDDIVPASELPTLLYSAGRLVPLPEGASLAPTQAAAFLASPLLSWRGKLRAGLDLVLPRGGGGDESLGAFVTRRLGREFYERWAEPLLSGVYGGDPAELSLRSTFPRLAELERRHRSLIRGMSASSVRSGGPIFRTLARGLSSLVEALERSLEGVELVRKKAVGAAPSGVGWRLGLTDGRKLEAEALVLAVPAFAAAELLGSAAPVSIPLVQIEYGDAATVSFGFAGAELPKASGFLVPKAAGRSILGATFSSNKYPGRAPAGASLARVYFGGRGDWADYGDGELAAIALLELSELAGLRSQPSLTRVFRWRRAMPQYRVGHERLLESIQAALPPRLILAGSAYRGVGLSDCVESGRRAAASALAGKALVA
jgi:protoporphyrinogen/coproporphyrinogen III oxidase